MRRESFRIRYSPRELQRCPRNGGVFLFLVVFICETVVNKLRCKGIIFQISTTKKTNWKIGATCDRPSDGILDRPTVFPPSLRRQDHATPSPSPPSPSCCCRWAILPSSCHPCSAGITRRHLPVRPRRHAAAAGPSRRPCGAGITSRRLWYVTADVHHTVTSQSAASSNPADSDPVRRDVVAK